MVRRVRKGLLFPVLIFLLFVLLKVANVIKWSWWWIFSPLWIPVSIFIIVVLIIFAVFKATHKNMVIYKNQ